MSSLSPFRLVIAGAGLITRGSHLPAALSHPDIDVVGIADPVIERARQLADEYGLGIPIAAEIEELLGDVDGCLIACPNQAHADVAKTCLEAGSPVLIEKPFSTTLADAVAVNSLAAEKRLVVGIGYVTRFQDNVLLLEEILRSHRFGRPRRFAYEFGTRGGWAATSGYTLSREATGGGVTVVTGTHFLDRMLHFFGWPDEVTYRDDSRGGPEANSACSFAFRDAKTGGPLNGVARFSKTVGLGNGMVIEFDDGVLVMGERHDDELIFRPNDGDEIEMVVRHKPSSSKTISMNGFERQLDNFVAAVRGLEPIRVDGQAGALSMRLLDWLYRSHQPLDEAWTIPSTQAQLEVA